MDRRKVHTYDNTPFAAWFQLANRAFIARGLPMPQFGAARDAYEMGESPTTWADYVLHSELPAGNEGLVAEYANGVVWVSRDGVQLGAFASWEAAEAFMADDVAVQNRSGVAS